MNLLRVFVDIALWKRGPQDLPASPVLLAAVIAIYAGLSVVLSAIAPNPDERVLARLAIDTAFSLLWTGGLLLLFHRGARFLQTMTAMIGTAVLLEPLLTLVQTILMKLGQAHPLALPVMLILVVLLVWYLIINARILRSALEIPMLAAVLLTLLQAVCSYTLSINLLPSKG